MIEVQKQRERVKKPKGKAKQAQQAPRGASALKALLQPAGQAAGSGTGLPSWD